MPVNTFMEKSDPENTSDHIEYSFAELNLSYLLEYKTIESCEV